MKNKNALILNPKMILFLGVLGVSFSSIIIKFSEAPSSVLATYRLGWTVLVMLPLVLLKFRKELKQLSKSDFLWNMLSGFFLALHFTLWFESLKFTSVASSTVLVTTEVIFAALGYVLILKGKINKIGILAITITLLGSGFIAAGDFGIGQKELYGDILSLIGAIMVALYTLIASRQRKHLSTTVFTFVTYSSCFITLLIINVASGTKTFGYPPKELFLGLLLSVSCTLLGHSVFSWCLKYLSPSFVSSAKLLEPIYASFMAIFLFQEIPDIKQILGGIIVIGGVFLYSRLE